MRQSLDRLATTLSPQTLFPTAPTLHFRPEGAVCACGGALQVRKTTRRTIATLAIGEFCAHLTQLVCRQCGQRVKPDELDRVVPPHGKFGFDVMVHIGAARFAQCRSRQSIQCELAARGVRLSLREIDHLSRQFIVYLYLAHRESQDRLKQFMRARGGYILHLDGTREGDSPHLMSSIDGLSRLVLGNVKLPSENAGQITAYLQGIKAAYGEPIALVHDMGGAILKAVAQVFPGLPDYICHFHFLTDLGKDLFGHDYGAIRRHVKRHRVRGALRKMARALKQTIDNDPARSDCLNRYLTAGQPEGRSMILPPSVVAYLIVAWVLEANSEANGFGFPFDRPHLSFYRRLTEAHPVLKHLKARLPRAAAASISLSPLHKTLADPALSHTVTTMQEKVAVFDRLRDTLRIALPESDRGLNDMGEADMKTIKARVTAFRDAEDIRQLAATGTAYRKMVQQIDKYWDKLFADPITVTSAHGVIEIQPQRTNNLMERFFRDMKRGDRKKSGTRALSRTLAAMLADTPLVKNLENPDYMTIVLKGKANLAERFADIDRALARQTLRDAQKAVQKYPKHMGKLFKIPHLPAKLGKNPLTLAA